MGRRVYVTKICTRYSKRQSFVYVCFQVPTAARSSQGGGGPRNPSVLIEVITASGFLDVGVGAALVQEELLDERSKLRVLRGSDIRSQNSQLCTEAW